jgi:hypothetical protein
VLPPPATPRQIVGSMAAVAAVATLLTIAMAWPVVRDPGATVFGPALAGPHPDPFVVAAQYERGTIPSPYLQPATDLPGIALAQATSGLTAYNLLVLASFPLTAAFTFALGMVLTRSRIAGVAAAAAFTWAPFHLAHAPYHVHIVQVQWWPLLLLALCVAVRGPWIRGLAIIALPAVLLVTASFYWGLAALFVVPAMLATFWWMPGSLDPPVNRRTAAHLLLIAIVVGVTALAAATTFVDLDTAGFGAADRAWYSARWFSLFLPAVTHPWLGAASEGVWNAAGAGPGLLEQQLGLGIGVLVLAGIAVIRRWRSPADPLVAAVPFLLVVGFVAWAASVFGGSAVGDLLPMFRAYARIGVVAILALTVLAGIGGAILVQTRVGRPVAVALLLLTAVELYPPADRWNPALPTAAHTWLKTNVPDAVIFDCTAPGRVYGQTVRAQFPGLVRFRETPFEDCVAPDIGGTLAAHGVSHMVLRRALREARWLESGGFLDGLSIAEQTSDALVLRVDAPKAGVYVTDVIGLQGREFLGRDTWRWMGAQSEWLVLNRTTADVRATFEIVAGSISGERTLRLILPSGEMADARVGAHGTYQLGPVTMPVGETRVRLTSLEGGTEATTVRLHQWRWRID